MRFTRPAIRRGFTLIELLIVIAIILILIAIALPNFLEAQIRARVTKSKAEIRTYTTALDSYYLDWGNYPRDHDSRWPRGDLGGASVLSQNGFIQLTTPIAYLTSLPVDPFGANTDDPAGNAAFYYEGGSGSHSDTRPSGCARRPALPCGCGDPIGVSALVVGYPYSKNLCIHAYLVIGIGPDATDSSNGNDEFPYHIAAQTAGSPPAISFNSYSPTNGTKSRGDIYGMTGEYANGYFFLDGQIIGRP